jgi:RNA polymerase sigma-70 factor (ECF subfamily)
MSDDKENHVARGGFQPTAWTQVLNVRDGDTTTAEAAWGHLVDLYWKPVFFQIRRNGHKVEDAQDLTQQFFYLLMKRESLRAVDPEKGKFRSFLMAALRHFLCDEYDRRNAAKRQINEDFIEAETQFVEASTFERDWATSVLDRAFAKLRKISPREARILESQRKGKTAYAELSAELGTSEANINVMAHRGKKKLRAIILEELRDTVSDPGAEHEELQELFRALS